MLYWILWTICDKFINFIFQFLWTTCLNQQVFIWMLMLKDENNSSLWLRFITYLTVIMRFILCVLNERKNNVTIYSSMSVWWDLKLFLLSCKSLSLCAMLELLALSIHLPHASFLFRRLSVWDRPLHPCQFPFYRFQPANQKIALHYIDDIFE